MNELRKHETSWSEIGSLLGNTLAVFACGYGLLAFIFRLRPRLDPMPDFVQDWTSGRNFLAGGPIYSDLNEMVTAHLPLEQVGQLAISHNVHPPFSVLLTLPLALLDYPTAFLVWNLLSVAAMLLAIWLIIGRQGLRLPAWTWLPILAVVLPSYAFSEQTFQGQFNLLLMLLITAAWVSDRRDRPGIAGLLLGTAAAIKLFPLFLFAFFLARRRWSALATGGLTFLILNAVTALTFGLAAYQLYVTDALPHTNDYYDHLGNTSLAGFWAKLLAASRPNVIVLWNNPWLARVATSVSISIVLLACLRKSARARSVAESDGAFSLCIIAMLLSCPVTWCHYFLLLIPALCILWADSPATWWSRGALTACTVALAINPWLVWRICLPSDGAIVASPLHTVTIISFQLYALIGLLILAYRQPAVSAGGAVAGAVANDSSNART